MSKQNPMMGKFKLFSLIDHQDTKKQPLHMIISSATCNFFLGSDGAKDLIGGSKGKKLGSNRLKEILFETRGKFPNDQKEKINHDLKLWQGEHLAFDDIIFIGFTL